MPESRQRLILFSLFFATASAAVTIKSFKAAIDLGIMGENSTIFANMVQLWAEVDGCPQSKCKCEVAMNTPEGIKYNMKFLDKKLQWGSVQVSPLDGKTTYTFNLTCDGVEEPAIVTLTTLVGRPSAPQDVATALDGKRMKLTWVFPAKPHGPIDIYQIKVDQNPKPINESGKALSYAMLDDYVPGTKHIFYVQACNKDEDNILLCSAANEGVGTYEPDASTTITTTISPSTASPVVPTTKSLGRQSQGVSVVLISVCLFLFHAVL